jgi:hypothetical protein
MACQAWWFTPVIPALRRLRQEDRKLETSLGYIVGPCHKQTNKKIYGISLVLGLRIFLRLTIVLLA